MKLSEAEREILAYYKGTSDGQFTQGIPGAAKLCRPKGLLQWRGEQYGCSFYSITPAGLKALGEG